MNERKMVEHILDAIEHLEDGLDYGGPYFDRISPFKLARRDR